MEFLDRIKEQLAQLDFFHCLYCLRVLFPNKNVIFSTQLQLSPTLHALDGITVEENNIIINHQHLSIFKYFNFNHHAPLLSAMTEANSAILGLADVYHQALMDSRYELWLYWQATPYQYQLKARSLDPKSDSSTILMDLLQTITGLSNLQCPLGEHSLFNYLGLLHHSPRSPHSLSTILGDYFGLTIRLQAWSGTWLPSARHQQVQLNGEQHPTYLTGQSLLGTQYYSWQRCFAIIIDFEQYQAYLNFRKDQPKTKALKKWLNHWLGMSYTFNIYLTINAQQLPLPYLQPTQPLYLGYNGLLTSAESKSWQHHKVLQFVV